MVLNILLLQIRKNLSVLKLIIAVLLSRKGTKSVQAITKKSGAGTHQVGFSSRAAACGVLAFLIRSGSLSGSG